MPRDDANNIHLSEELQDALKEILRQCEKEEKSIRKRQLKKWKKNEEFWHGLQHIFWSEKNEGWMSVADMTQRELSQQSGLKSLYDYVINIYKAHGESIISALAAKIPGVRFPPDDADNEEDVATSKAYTRITDLIYRHNQVETLFLHALFLLYNQPMIASYHYLDTDKSYGTIQAPDYKEVPVCPSCGEVRDTPTCIQCGSLDPPVMETRAVGVVELPKSRAIMEVFGPLNVKVTMSAPKQRDLGYVILYTDQPIDLIKSIHPHLEEKLGDEDEISSERQARSSSQHAADFIAGESFNVVVKRCWFRPWKYNIIKDKDIRKKLQEKFPTGCFVIFVGNNDLYAQARDEDLDDHWCIGKATLSRFVIGDAIGQPIVPLNEMKNQLATLTMDTIDHSVPTTFADPRVVNFRAYRDSEAAPGMLAPAKPRPPNYNLRDSFFTEPRAVLPKEMTLVNSAIERDAQFTLGSFPSIYGGPAEGKTRTLGEYATSKQMALQRLSIIYKMVSFWWAKAVYLTARMFAKAMVEDERFTKYSGTSYVNVWIRKGDLTGKIGEVEPESSDSFPVSLTQIRDILLELITLNNEYVNAALYHPENAKLIAQSLAMPEFKIPGELQRSKQAIEINDLLQSEADEMGFPSIVPDPDVDDHVIHIEVLRTFLVDLPGMEAKKSNPKGYQNCIAHLRLHKMMLMQSQGVPSGSVQSSNTSNESDSVQSENAT
jgi:hypothetical protein